MEKRIEIETRALAASILQFGKQTDQWLAASHALHTAIKVKTLYIVFMPLTKYFYRFTTLV